MRYVAVRDDDTNATTPPWCLERLYRPFFERNLPVNLAVIPEVSTDIRLPDGRLEGFLFGGAAGQAGRTSVGSNNELMAYIRENKGFHALQHGLTHEFHDGKFEFDLDDRAEIARRLERGSDLMVEAGFPKPTTFVAPQDTLTSTGLEEVVRRYSVLSTGWYEFRRLPLSWRFAYLRMKIMGQAHWRIGKTRLFSHPGCLLSRNREYATMFDTIKRAISGQAFTVLVTHWWEYFPNGTPDQAFIQVLHETAEYLASSKDIEVIPFSEITADNSSFF